MNKRRKTSGLNDKQRRFVREYLIDLNATQAALRAGYSRKTAYSQGQRLLKHVEIARLIAEKQEKAGAEAGITQARVLEELAILSFSDVRHYTVDAKGELVLAAGAPDSAWRAVSSVKHKITKAGEIVHHEIEFKLWDKPGPLKLAGLHAGLKFIERKEVTGPDGGPIETVTKIERVIVDSEDDGKPHVHGKGSRG